MTAPAAAAALRPPASAAAHGGCCRAGVTRAGAALLRPQAAPTRRASPSSLHWPLSCAGHAISQRPLRLSSRPVQAAAVAADGDAVSTSSTDRSGLLEKLEAAILQASLLPGETAVPAHARNDSEATQQALAALKEAGQAKLWDSLPSVGRRNTFLRELSSIGIKNAEKLATPSVRNDAAFLAAVVGGSSIVAVLAGQLPGDWGFFVPYLVGSLSLVVLAIGSTAPGLLQVAINAFSGGFSDQEDRLLRHEAAHFLTAYLLGLPVVNYSLDIGKEHVNLVDEKLQKRIYEGRLDTRDLDRLAVVSMAGLAAEGLKYDQVMGQSADLFTLQRLVNRSKEKLGNQQQQNITRWAVYYAASLLKTNSKQLEALMAAMKSKASVPQCIQALESAT
eukprot:SM000036S13275  [mRNA]  locus=s36:299064:301836:+ [translate_table: standard]